MRSICPERGPFVRRPARQQGDARALERIPPEGLRPARLDRAHKLPEGVQRRQEGNFAAGLVLYWITMNFVQGLQQWWMFRDEKKAEKEKTTKAEQKDAKKNKKKGK